MVTFTITVHESDATCDEIEAYLVNSGLHVDKVVKVEDNQ